MQRQRAAVTERRGRRELDKRRAWGKRKRKRNQPRRRSSRPRGPRRSERRQRRKLAERRHRRRCRWRKHERGRDGRWWGAGFGKQRLHRAALQLPERPYLERDRASHYESAGTPTLASLKKYAARRDQFGIIPYATPLDAAFVEAAAESVRYVYLTDDDLPNPWDALPSYFDALLGALEP